MKKNVLCVGDTETCNIVATDKVTPGNNLTYNIGFHYMEPATGKVLAEKSYIVEEIFFGEAERMKTAYYADKIPGYLSGIHSGEYIVKSFFEIMNELVHDCEKYGVTAIVAHNARFDVDALNTTARWLTGLNYIRALPQNIEIWDSMKMARDIFLPRPSYRKFCEENGYMTKHATPRPRVNAETLYRFISNNLDFEEEHTALSDCRIEAEIILACYRAHKHFEKVLFPA